MDIKDYLHLYLPFDYKYFDQTIEITGIEYKKKNWIRFMHENGFFELLAKDVRLPLRPLGDMTEEEKAKYRSVDIIYNSNNILPEIRMSHLLNAHYSIKSAQLTRLLLSQGFDIYGLIDSGFAIDKTKGGAGV